jgi:type I restriction enzyme S subunit
VNFNIPETWLALRLGDVIDYGKTEKIEPDDIEEEMWVLELEDVEKDTARLLAKVAFKDRQSKSTKNKFNKGDVLYGKLRPYLNKIIIADQEGCCTTEIIPLKSNGVLDNRYLFYWLRHPDFLEYVADVSHGINMPRLGTDAGKASPFVLAPFNEQKRIADKLDTLLTVVDDCRARLDRAPGLIKRFRQSVLAAATSGALTEDWHENIAWDYSTAENECEWITKGTTPPKSDMHEGFGDVPFIKVYNLCFDGKLDFTINPTFVDVSTHKGMLKRSMVFPGDILMNIVGPPLGKISIVPETYPEWNINQAIAVFRVKERINRKFLTYILMCEATISDLINKSKATAGQFNLTLEICRSIVVPIPSMEEQTEIVRRVEALFDVADKMEASVATARKRVDQLTPSILAQAFRGELVEQDPTDEPASALLARIAAACTPAPAKRTTKKAA